MPGAASAFDLSGRVALITGGSRGLGRAMAGGLARAGAAVVVASRDLGSCQAAATEIAAETGRRALPYRVHVGHWDELAGLVDFVYERLGHLDVLVNNAGMSPLYDSAESITEELFDKVIGVNFKGPFRLAALAGARMSADRGGSIINISSSVSLRPRPDVLPYAAAKAALNNLTAGLALAYGPTVRCNAIVCGTFLTDVSRSWDQAAFEDRASHFALRRGGQPNEIIGTALYLASDASSYTTGAVIPVDGGQP
jgi:NAD(P)-dependent dehydrogenase (short-subunit alcohol dehydrogenase family)